MGLAYTVMVIECGTTEPVEWRSGNCGAGSSILLRHSAQQDMKIMSVSYFQLGTFHLIRLNIKQSQYITNVCPSLRGLPSSDDKAEISRHDYPIYDKSSPLTRTGQYETLHSRSPDISPAQVRSLGFDDRHMQDKPHYEVIRCYKNPSTSPCIPTPTTISSI